MQRKREQHIPNPSGYFVSALKGDWSSQNIVESDLDRQSSEVDKGAVFRHWYDLSRELGVLLWAGNQRRAAVGMPFRELGEVGKCIRARVFTGIFEEDNETKSKFLMIRIKYLYR